MNVNTIDFSNFDRRFSTEEQCLAHLASIRWQNGYCCPRCSDTEYWEVSPYKYKCRNCGYQTTVTAGTFFHHTHVPMLVWFKAIWYVSVKGDSAKTNELQSLLHIGSYHTALTMLNRIQSHTNYTIDEASINRRLSGEIELSAFYDSSNTISPCTYILSEVHRRDKANHIRIAVLPRKNSEKFAAFIRSNIREGSIINCDRMSKSYVYAIKEYKFRLINTVYTFPCCERIFDDYQSKINSSSNESRKKKTSVIIKELVWKKNRWVNDISFDDLLRNIMSNR